MVEQIERKAFETLILDEERIGDRPDVFSVRLNKEERVWLDDIKADLNVAQDGKALKICALCGKNVLQGTFGRGFLRYLFKKDRLRKDDFD